MSESDNQKKYLSAIHLFIAIFSKTEKLPLCKSAHFPVIQSFSPSIFKTHVPIGAGSTKKPIAHSSLASFLSSDMLSVPTLAVSYFKMRILPVCTLPMSSPRFVIPRLNSFSHSSNSRFLK